MTPNSGTALGLTILATAVGGTLATPAEAALVSTAPAKFAPVTVTSTSGSLSFDLDGDGSNDFTLSGNGSNVTLTPLNMATSGTGSLFNSLVGYTNPSSLSIGNVKTGTATIGVNSDFAGFAIGQTEFAALATNATFAATPYTDAMTATAGTLGYLEGTLLDASTFQLLDYGLVVPDTAVPEPASLALLATGAAGIAALRRRRAARHAPENAAENAVSTPA